MMLYISLHGCTCTDIDFELRLHTVWDCIKRSEQHS